jgi:hypothetical protein
VDRKIVWIRNNGDSTFATVTLRQQNITVDSIEAVDLDSDGDMDVLLANINGTGSSTFSWLKK